MLNAAEFRKFRFLVFRKVVQRHVQGVMDKVTWVLF